VQEGDGKKDDTDVSVRMGQATGAKWKIEGALGSRLMLQNLYRQHGWKKQDPVVSEGFRCPE
jgi:hypothetical protein